VGRAFEKRKHTIFARMDRVGKQFAKVGKDIAIAVKAGGPNPDGNPSLRRALQNARALNMPKDRVEAAIKKASGQSAASYDVIIYEGYAPHGIALLVEAATDNVTRTVANVRHAFKHHGGNMGTTGSVAFMFERHGVFRLSPAGIDRDNLELELIDHGLLALEDGESDKGEKQLIVRCPFADFGAMHTALESRGVATISTEFEYVAPTLTELPDDKADEVMQLVAALEGDDDVQNVYSNLA
jgi:YebC/PmpR family DNA-binding regulatory protein